MKETKEDFVKSINSMLCIHDGGIKGRHPENNGAILFKAECQSMNDGLMRMTMRQLEDLCLMMAMRNSRNA